MNPTVCSPASYTLCEVPLVSESFRGSESWTGRFPMGFLLQALLFLFISFNHFIIYILAWLTSHVHCGYSPPPSLFHTHTHISLYLYFKWDIEREQRWTSAFNLPCLTRSNHLPPNWEFTEQSLKSTVLTTQPHEYQLQCVSLQEALQVCMVVCTCAVFPYHCI